MKIVIVSAKTVVVRHWFRWYRVQRGMTDWQRLKIQARLQIDPKAIAARERELYGNQGNKTDATDHIED